MAALSDRLRAHAKALNGACDDTRTIAQVEAALFALAAECEGKVLVRPTVANETDRGKPPRRKAAWIPLNLHILTAHGACTGVAVAELQALIDKEEAKSRG